MKILSKVILILIIVVPIVLCVTTLNKVWSEDENRDKINAGIEESGKISGDASIFYNEDISSEVVDESGEMAGEKFENTLGGPISKIYTDAKVAISVANVYAESSETSEIVGTLEKYTIVTAQKYSEGWSRITNDTISGWMRTENITFPEGGNLDTNGSIKTGKVKADVLNMRASASTSAAIITTIPNGAELTIKEEVNGWYKVTYASAIGWVSADYVVLNK